MHVFPAHTREAERKMSTEEEDSPLEKIPIPNPWFHPGHFPPAKSPNPDYSLSFFFSSSSSCGKLGWNGILCAIELCHCCVPGRSVALDFFVYWSKLDHPTFNLSWEWNLKDRIVFGHVLCVGIGIGIFNNVYQCMYYAVITSKTSFATVSGTQANFFKQHFTERPCVWDLFFAQTPPFPFLDQVSLLISGGRKKRGKGGIPLLHKGQSLPFRFPLQGGVGHPQIEWVRTLEEWRQGEEWWTRIHPSQFGTPISKFFLLYFIAMGFWSCFLQFCNINWWV